jgi:hypothetical protein
MKKLAAMRDDLAALGAMAPVRALYEVAKRSGAHGLVLRTLAKSATPANLVVVQQFRPQRGITDATRDRCLADAALIVSQGHRAFGVRVPIDGPDDWNKIGPTALRWPADRHWWQIDIRTDQRLGDVKWTWELGRHRDLVVLARAAYLEPDGEWQDQLAKRLRFWFEATPAERSVHWYSNLEIALRVIAWMQIYALCSEELPGDVLDAMALHLAQARRHLMVDFPYTASSMRNNHLLGDALGLLAIDRFSGGHADGRLATMAEKSFRSQLERHMHSDGSMIEDSLSYHRFVMEMLAIKVLLGDCSGSTRRALQSSALHLQRLGVFDGPVPQWGDWDEGRVLASSGDALDLAGSTALGLALTGTSGPQHWLEFDEVSWYFAPPNISMEATGAWPNEFEARPATSVSSNGGITRVRAGSWTVWFKCGTGPSHEHADLTHVSARYGGQWVLVDPGTGTYNGDLAVRNAFRTSRAHNGLRLLGEEMFVPHRAFRWLTSATAYAGPPVCVGDAVVVWALHDAYSRLAKGSRVARAVVVTAEGFTCIDWREGNDSDALLTVALPSGTKVTHDALVLGDDGVSGRPTIALNGLEGASVIEGEQKPFGGWHSATYGEWRPAPWLEYSVTGPRATTWGASERSAAAHAVMVDGTLVNVGGIGIDVDFRPGGATLSVSFAGKSSLSIAGKAQS